MSSAAVTPGDLEFEFEPDRAPEEGSRGADEEPAPGPDAGLDVLPDGDGSRHARPPRAAQRAQGGPHRDGAVPRAAGAAVPPADAAERLRRRPRRRPRRGIPLPTEEEQIDEEQTIATQEELSQSIGAGEVGGTGDSLVIAPPSEESLPGYGEYVYVEELPEAITKVMPEYPDLARQSSMEGTVVVQALVGKDGRVKDTRIAKSNPVFDQAAEKAVKQYVFKPALSNNKPVAVWVAVPIRFVLN